MLAVRAFIALLVAAIFLLTGIPGAVAATAPSSNAMSMHMSKCPDHLAPCCDHSVPMQKHGKPCKSNANCTGMLSCHGTSAVTTNVAPMLTPAITYLALVGSQETWPDLALPPNNPPPIV